MKTIYSRIGKRFFDMAIVVPALVILSPLLFCIAVLVRMQLGSPVFFRQVRPGLRGRTFTIYKFRTMTDERDAQGNLLPDEMRMTRFGNFLRVASIDELPALFNVLRGDMSLVGPRPLLVEYLSLYSAFQHRRHEVLPGVTGMAQVMGRNELSWDEKFRLDVWYVDHQSFSLDLKILSLTAWKVLKREGINQPGKATMGKFKGNTKPQKN